MIWQSRHFERIKIASEFPAVWTRSRGGMGHLKSKSALSLFQDGSSVRLKLETTIYKGALAWWFKFSYICKSMQRKPLFYDTNCFDSLDFVFVLTGWKMCRSTFCIVIINRNLAEVLLRFETRKKKKVWLSTLSHLQNSPRWSSPSKVVYCIGHPGVGKSSDRRRIFLAARTPSIESAAAWQWLITGAWQCQGPEAASKPGG